MEPEKELTREELKTCISSYKSVILMQAKEIELLKKDNEFLSKKPEFDYRYKYENYKIYAEHKDAENKQLKKNFKKLDNDYDNLLDKCKKFESANEGLHKELSDHRFDKQIIKSLQDNNKQLKSDIEKLEQEYNELKSQYDMGLIYSIKDGVVMTKKYDDLNEKESIYRHILHKVASNNGFLVQTFKDYSNLQFCYDNFIKHGFDVQQVGSDTLIIRNK